MALGWLLLGGAAGAAATWMLVGKPSPASGRSGECLDSFRRVRFADISNTSMKAEIKAPYRKLVQAFGEPEKFGGDGETYNEWQFKGPGGVYVIYDHNRDGSKSKTYPWHIGSKVDYPEMFLAWLEHQLKGSSKSLESLR